MALVAKVNRVGVDADFAVQAVQADIDAVAAVSEAAAGNTEAVSVVSDGVADEPGRNE